MHVCKYDCLRSESKSASPPQLKGVRVISACARARVCADSCRVMLIKLDKQKTDTFIHICEAYINTHTRLSDETPAYTHTYTFNTFTQVQYTANTHEKRLHSPKRYKPGKNAVWQGRQLAVGQTKPPVSRRNRELDRQLSGILSKAHKQHI
jgi:hypothetical protein